MTSRSRITDGAAGIWERTIQLDRLPSVTAAKALLEIQFSAEDRDRMRQLSAKARAGTLSQAEQKDIDTYERLGCLLDILHSKARRALKRRRSE